MRIKILGTQAPFQTNGRKGIGYLVTTKDGNFMLDAGSGSHSGLTFEDYEKLSLILSHGHFDHVADVNNILYAAVTLKINRIVPVNLSIYLPKEYDEILEDRMVTKTVKANKLANIVRYSSETKFSVGNTEITFLKTSHSEDSYAIKITEDNKSVGYTGDISPEDIGICAEFFKDIDLIISECSLAQDYPRQLPHMRPLDCTNLKNLSGAKRMLLTHFYPRQQEEEYAKVCLQHTDNVQIAYEGMIIDL